MLQIEPIPALKDNYIWCLHDGERAWIVDPGESEPVARYLQARQLTLEGILITHHHPDHIGGLQALTRAHAGITVYGPQNPRIEGITQRVGDADSVECLGVGFQVLSIPGHTLDHIAYFAEHCPDGPALFCGDTLFAGGCGRLFEGDPATMLLSLDRLAALPDQTRVYCAHEYTVANLRFALAVEPDNSQLQERAAEARARRAQEQPTLPSTLAEEKATNPFLRAREPEVIAAAEQQGAQDNDPVTVFTVIRRWKDGFG